jgi:hypothetical protein
MLPNPRCRSPGKTEAQGDELRSIAGPSKGALPRRPQFRQIAKVSKYSALRDRLRTSGKSEVRMSFDEISDLVPGGLPPSAYRHDAWWNNEADSGSTHSQSRLGWMAAGYTVVADRVSRRVIFTRHNAAG